MLSTVVILDEIAGDRLGVLTDLTPNKKARLI